MIKNEKTSSRDEKNDRKRTNIKYDITQCIDQVCQLDDSNAMYFGFVNYFIKQSKSQIFSIERPGKNMCLYVCIKYQSCFDIRIANVTVAATKVWKNIEPN
ncbi:hypothetical protein RF11_05941 [Thelohanellus kitauei]|uniref:Uncharacterized protein n=1 Tax=Thelohanellus kitauei TaxID=669202 RepID=A0A0C2MDJ0_THEKT|nr:hypothetical protein RF11_05941 [Thelohanellus kitauei]